MFQNTRTYSRTHTCRRATTTTTKQNQQQKQQTHLIVGLENKKSISAPCCNIYKDFKKERQKEGRKERNFERRDSPLLSQH